MAIVPGVHRANHADVVDDTGRLGQKFRDRGSALPVLGELPRSAEQLLARAVDETEHDFAVVLDAVSFRQFGLRVEQVDMRRTAVHEQRDHGLRPGSEVRRAGLQVQREVLTGLLRDVGERSVLAQQVGQGDRTDPEGGARQ